MRRWAGSLFICLATFGIAVAAYALRSHHDAPAVAPLPPEAQALADVTLIDGFKLKTPSKDRFRLIRGSASSVSEAGVWVTAAKTVEGCNAPMVMATDRRGLPAHVALIRKGGIAILTTATGAPPLPIADRDIAREGRAFHPGFPRLQPGELTTRRLGAKDLNGRRVDLYSETGRTDGLDGGYGGGLIAIAGTPVLDEAGRISGVSLSESSPRGLIVAAPISEVRDALAATRLPPATAPEGRAVTVDNYGIVGDALRRAASVAAVICTDPSPWPLNALR